MRPLKTVTLLNFNEELSRLVIRQMAVQRETDLRSAVQQTTTKKSRHLPVPATSLTIADHAISVVDDRRFQCRRRCEAGLSASECD